MSERMTDGDICALLEMTRHSGAVSVNAEVLRSALRELQQLRAASVDLDRMRPVYEAAKAAAVRWRKADAFLSDEARAMMEAVERAEAARNHS